jgi:hypothetical protein
MCKFAGHHWGCSLVMFVTLTSQLILTCPLFGM